MQRPLRLSCSNNATLEADPLAPNGITEENIPSLILPQATSARQAVQARPLRDCPRARHIVVRI